MIQLHTSESNRDAVNSAVILQSGLLEWYRSLSSHLKALGELVRVFAWIAKAYFNMTRERTENLNLQHIPAGWKPPASF
jgi:hypothetical protein